MDNLIDLYEVLTDREYKILEALADGLPRKEMLKVLKIQRENTLDERLRNIYRKLDVTNRGEAIKIFWRYKLSDNN